MLRILLVLVTVFLLPSVPVSKDKGKPEKAGFENSEFACCQGPPPKFCPPTCDD